MGFKLLKDLLPVVDGGRIREVDAKLFKVEASLVGIRVVALGAMFCQKGRDSHQRLSKGTESPWYHVTSENQCTPVTAKRRSCHAGCRVSMLAK